jgi:N-acetylneuraminate synthase
MNGERLAHPIKADDPLTINHMSGPYRESEALKSLILNRGI